MRSVSIIITLKIEQLLLQINRRPKQHPVQVLAPNRADQSLDERMRKRHVRNSLDFRYLEYPQISLPLMESIQRIIIRAEILWQTLPTNGATEHSAQRYSVYNAAVDAKPYQPPCKLVHHHENPMCSQRCRLASEQIAAPQAVLYMAEKGEPGWTRTRESGRGNARSGYGETYPCRCRHQKPT